VSGAKKGGYFIAMDAMNFSRDFVALYERDCETESKRLIEKGFIKDGTGLLLILQAPSPSTLCSVRIDI
jgi:hypothetical protein